MPLCAVGWGPSDHPESILRDTSAFARRIVSRRSRRARQYQQIIGKRPGTAGSAASLSSRSSPKTRLSIGYNAGPKAAQLFVHPAGGHHRFDRESTLFATSSGQGQVPSGWPPSSAAVDPASSPGKSIGRVTPHRQTIQDQRGSATEKLCAHSSRPGIGVLPATDHHRVDFKRQLFGLFARRIEMSAAGAPPYNRKAPVRNHRAVIAVGWWISLSTADLLSLSLSQAQWMACQVEWLREPGAGSRKGKMHLFDHTQRLSEWQQLVLSIRRRADEQSRYSLRVLLFSALSIIITRRHDNRKLELLLIRKSAF